MKKIILASITAASFGLSSMGMAADCVAPMTGPQTCDVAETGNYLEVDFPFSVSAGVQINYAETTGAIGATTGHDKGGYTYAGTSEGGNITTCTAVGSTFTLPAPQATGSGSLACDL